MSLHAGGVPDYSVVPLGAAPEEGLVAYQGCVRQVSSHSKPITLDLPITLLNQHSSFIGLLDIGSLYPTI